MCLTGGECSLCTVLCQHVQGLVQGMKFVDSWALGAVYSTPIHRRFAEVHLYVPVSRITNPGLWAYGAVYVANNRLPIVTAFANTVLLKPTVLPPINKVTLHCPPQSERRSRI